MLSFKSLSKLVVSTALADKARIVFQTESGEFLNAELTGLRTYMTADVNARIDAIVQNPTSTPSIWPTARKLTLGGALTGNVSFNGSADFTLTAQIADNGLTIAKTQGLSTELSAIHDEIDAVDAKVAGKADVDHTHIRPYDNAFTSSTFADHRLGINLAGYTSSDINYNVLQMNGGDIVTQFRMGGQGLLRYRTLDKATNTWSTEVTIWTNATLFPADYARLDGAIFAGPVSIRGDEFSVRPGTATSNPLLSLRNFAGLPQGGLTWDRTTDTIRLQRASGDGAGIEGELSMSATEMTFNGYSIYHAGNLNVAGLLTTGGGIKEVFTDTPTVYGAAQNTNDLPAGRAVVPQTAPNTPGSTSALWYVETTIVNTGNNRVQKAVGIGSGEVWLRAFNGTSWTSWRRQWDNTNLSTANFLTRGSAGLGGVAETPTDLNSLSGGGWYRYRGVDGPTTGDYYLVQHIQGQDTAHQLAFRGQRYWMRSYGFESTTAWQPWIELPTSAGGDVSSKWDVTAATAHGLQGAVPLAAAMNARDLQGLGLFSTNLSGSTGAPAYAGTGQAMTLHMQSGSLTVGGLAQLSTLGIQSDNPELFLRTGNAGTYGAWAKILTDKNLIVNDVMIKRTNLAAQNLNTITTTGFYQQLLDSNATGALNYPLATGGLLEVYAPSATYVWQEYRIRNSSVTYRRYLYSGAWSSWKQTLDAGGAAEDYLGQTPRLIDNTTTDCNTITAERVLIRSGAPNTPPAQTGNDYWLVESVNSYNSSNRMQRAYTYNGAIPFAYTRSLFGTTWTPWTKAVNNGDTPIFPQVALGTATNGGLLYNSDGSTGAVSIRSGNTTLYAYYSFYQNGEFHALNGNVRAAKLLIGGQGALLQQASNPTLTYISTAGEAAAGRGWRTQANVADSSDGGYRLERWSGSAWVLASIAGENGHAFYQPSGTGASVIAAHGTRGVQTGTYGMWASGNRLWQMGYETNRNFMLWTYDDNGTYMGNPLQLSRAGDLNILNRISSGGGHYTSTSANTVLSAGGGGAVYLRAGGADNASGQAYLQTDGLFVVGDMGLASDRAYKDQIVDLPYNGRLQPREWIDIRTGKKMMGFVSQEVQERYPHLVAKGQDGLLQLKYANALAVVSHQANQLEDRVIELTAENADLKKRLERLEAIVLGNS